ncbi:nitrilase-related carbon-nitrogen hydrolase [Nocardia thailandica]|uniref:nitrilase-related carbon-nitrogen hydrolase n=1 Tax=Nocardia thailandica TaxID=257275 RepID=UPI000694B318|nr:nitrilase-related carbon-nitrogen hydrolase [Nocardia thailandica]
MKQVRVAAVQAEPKWLHLAAGVEQAIGLIEQAAAGGARLVAFPECFLPGYPWWMWLPSVDWGDDFLARYRQNALSADGAELRALAYAARRTEVHVSIGFAERVRGTVLMSQAFIDAEGTVSISRKAEPTGLERTVFGTGSGEPLVRDTALGRIGVLGGADHLRDDMRGAIQAEREQIHIASWSGFTAYHGVSKDRGAEINHAADVRYAMDTRAYVIAPVAIVPVAGWEVVDARSPERRLLRSGGGTARILGPSGLDMAPPLAPEQEGLLFADLDMTRAPQPRRVSGGLLERDVCRVPSGRVARREPARPRETEPA